MEETAPFSPLRHLPALALALPVPLPEREFEEERRLWAFAKTSRAAALFQQSNDQAVMLHQQQQAAASLDEKALVGAHLGLTARGSTQDLHLISSPASLYP